MERQVNLMRHSLLLFILSVSSFSVSLAGPKSATGYSSTRENPFTAKASLIRYWNKRISNNLPMPPFLLSKASPLSAVNSAVLANLAAKNALSDHLSFFCSAANLFCLFVSSSTLDKLSTQDANFTSYSNKRFSNYGKARLAGVDLFKKYSGALNFATGSFTRYSSSSTGHKEGFTNYANDANVADNNFTSYGASATGGSGEFTNYVPRVNIPNLRFASYNSEGNNHKLSFSSYADDTNAGSEGFTGYGKNGNGVPVEFTSYGDTSNVVGSTFTGYGQLGNGANDSFKSYTSNANNPTNNFKSYSVAGNSVVDSFTGYRDGANAGTDSFQSYAKKSNSAKANFLNYGNSFNQGIDSFKGYGEGSTGTTIGFKIYGVNSTFKGYADKGVTFAGYRHASSSNLSSSKVSGISVNRSVQPGKFFREYMLKEGTVMQMPDIRDIMPKRSFLPRVVSSKLPFSTSRLPELKQIFHARDNSAMERMLVHALTECEQQPSPGETKLCVSSTEDIIDFAVTVLGRNVVVRTTKNVNGSKECVMIGKVKGINGGKVTKSVSCHQSLYPYILYYCHSVPKVRVYVADILDVKTKVKINQAVAICHIDTSAWSPGHGAFVALGSSPGLIEVCHWIFENDMTWTIAD